MPTRKYQPRKKPATRAKRSKSKKKQPRRGPVIRFKLGQLILLWILSLIICFGSYLYNRNFHPEKDVFVKSADSDTAEESSLIDDSALDTPVQDTPAENSAAETSAPEETPIVPDRPKINNPVPESAPQSPDYLAKCAFLGETNIYNLGQNHLLQPFCVYASETLTLTNYTKEYVMLEGTTIRILSAINSASCPIYLMFGTESLSSQPADQTADQFSLLLSSVKAQAPETKIYVMSIPPVTDTAEKSETPLLNSVIDDYNSRLLRLAEEEDVYYIDINTALKDNDGKLNPLYAEEDGIHLNLEGGKVLLNYVLNHIPVS